MGLKAVEGELERQRERMGGHYWKKVEARVAQRADTREYERWSLMIATMGESRLMAKSLCCYRLLQGCALVVEVSLL